MTITTPGRSVVTSSTTPQPPSSEVLAVPTVGGFYGRCPRGAATWTLRFVEARDRATDLIISRVDNGPIRRAEVNPGHAATFRLVANAARTTEPSDRISRHAATTVATTKPLYVQISQGTEPQFLRVDVRLALTTVGGETGQCALVGSRVNARTYFNGRP